jgi:hypothetical protein
VKNAADFEADSHFSSAHEQLWAEDTGLRLWIEALEQANRGFSEAKELRQQS